jgi:NAD-dependent histone deacetylase SIR2
METSFREQSPPTSPLSVLSQSPAPPSPLQMDVTKRYPSPTLSTPPSGSASPLKLADSGTEEIRVRTDGPPAKRRRITAPPKPRTTEYIDLESRGPQDDAALDRLVLALRKKKKIVVIAGAGISVSAGSTSPAPVHLPSAHVSRSRL